MAAFGHLVLYLFVLKIAGEQNTLFLRILPFDVVVLIFDGTDPPLLYQLLDIIPYPFVASLQLVVVKYAILLALQNILL